MPPTPPTAALLPGTLDLLILEAVSLDQTAGRGRLREERASWSRLADASAVTLAATAKEA